MPATLDEPFGFSRGSVKQSLFHCSRISKPQWWAYPSRRTNPLVFRHQRERWLAVIEAFSVQSSSKEGNKSDFLEYEQSRGAVIEIEEKADA